MYGDLDSTTLYRTDESLLSLYGDCTMTDNDPLDILLVEDVSSDALLLRLALDASQVPYRLRTIHGGDEVLPWLMRELGALPDVIMLDLGLPRMDGFEILEELAGADHAIRAIPIIILTGYQDFEYVGKSYNLCVPAYITKPCDAQRMHEVLAPIHRGK